MTQLENSYYEVIAMAKKLEAEGVCKVYDCEDSDAERRFSIKWNIQTGEDFVKASALVHAIDEWADYLDRWHDYETYSVEVDFPYREYMIDVFCVWL